MAAGPDPAEDQRPPHLQDNRAAQLTGHARRTVGTWPTPDAWADGLVEALAEAADQETDEAKRTSSGGPPTFSVVLVVTSWPKS